MLRSRSSLLFPLLFRDTTPGAQESELREAVRCHGAEVSAKAHDPYGITSAVHYPALRLTFLPATGGVHRQALRSAISRETAESFRRVVFAAPAERSASRRAILVGCRSVPYVRRQLSESQKTGAAGQFLIIDHALDRLFDMALALSPEFGARVQFVRGDALFVMQCLIPPAAADVCVAPMPVPFPSERSSHRRLITREFLCAAHKVLRAREDTTDARGFVTFTDTEALAKFMMEQLEESRLVVPWTRKNPAVTYAQWMPVDGEFVQQSRTGNVIALAASKSGETSAQAKALVEAIDFKRRYHRSLYV